VLSDTVPPRDRQALAKVLDEMGVREGTYHLFGAHLDDAMVMDRRPEGWVVFYTERGSEFGIATHAVEARACADLLARVTAEEHVFFERVAGPAPADEADEAFGDWLNERGVTAAELSPSDWKSDDVPWVDGAYWRRYFVRIQAIRSLEQTQ
jgi:hypothetical protein